MVVDALKANLSALILLRDELKVSTKYSRFTLSDYVIQAYNMIRYAKHGKLERFYGPQHEALIQLNELKKIDPRSFNSAYSKNKAKIVMYLNWYIKDMQRAFKEHEKATK